MAHTGIEGNEAADSLADQVPRNERQIISPYNIRLNSPYTASN